MDEFRKRYGTWALVAGSAEGLGKAFCKSLAGRSMNLVMADHEKASNEKLAGEIRSGFNVDTLPVEVDLAEAHAPQTLMGSIQGLECRLLIYNAAFSRVKPFQSNSPDELDHYIGVNCRTPLQLVYSFSSRLTGGHQGGGILLMSSLAGLYGTQLLAPYGATKAFNLILAEALHHEFKDKKIDVLACVAGATATPAYLSTNPDYGILRPPLMDPAAVAEKAVARLGRQAVYIPGTLNRMTHFFFSRLLTRKKAAGIFNRTTMRMYGKALGTKL
jgi:hypothetical protein